MPLNGEINASANASETLDLFGTVTASLNSQKDIAINGQNNAYIQPTFYINYIPPSGEFPPSSIGLNSSKNVELIASGESLYVRLTVDIDTITMDNALLNITDIFT